MLRRWMVGGLGGLMLASVVMARPGIVKTRDGRTLEGEVTDRGDQVDVTTHGIHTLLEPDQVLGIHYTEGFESELQLRRSKLPEGDARARLALARWAFQRRAYEQSRDLLEEAMEFDPRNRDVADMLEIVNQQIRLEQPRKTRPAEKTFAAPAEVPPPRNPRNDEPAAPRPRAAAKADPGLPRQLNADEINEIRQKEWREGEKMNGIRFENDVKRRYVGSGGLNAAEFNRLPIAQQAWAIVNHGTPEMAADVRLGDPPAVAEFRQVHRTIVAACANCHNEKNKDTKFVLFTGDTDTAIYSNFYALQKFNQKIPDNNPRDKDRGTLYQMIDRENPDRSLLVQYTLAPDIAKIKHPQSDFKGLAHTRNDRNLKQLIKWMGTDLKPITPEYSFDDQDGPATKPAARPAPARGASRADDAGDAPAVPARATSGRRAAPNRDADNSAR